jgi:hypothetical protein
MRIEHVRFDPFVPFAGGVSQQFSPNQSFDWIQRWVPQDLREWLQTAWDLDPEAVAMPPLLEHLEVATLVSPVTELLHKTDPRIPSVDLPSFVVEGIWQLPSLFLSQGRTLLQLGGDFHLKLQFGWRPLLSDLADFLDVSRLLAKRLKKLKRIRDEGLYSATTSLEESFDSQTATLEWPDDFPLEIPSVPLLTAEYQKVTKYKQWGQVTFGLPADALDLFQDLDDGELRWNAIRSQYGLYWRNPAALWEVLPWSWMVDWFVPIQHMLSQYSNDIPITPIRINVMTKITTSLTLNEPWDRDFPFKHLGVPDGSSRELWTPIQMERTTLLRHAAPPELESGSLPVVPSGRPFLSGHKYGILGAILASRGKFRS